MTGIFPSAGAGPIWPGQIALHSSDGSNCGDVGIEVGLTRHSSLYIGEISDQLLAEYDVVKPPVKGWWVCLRTASELRPLALIPSQDQGDEATALAYAVALAITSADGDELANHLAAGDAGMASG